MDVVVGLRVLPEGTEVVSVRLSKGDLKVELIPNHRDLTLAEVSVLGELSNNPDNNLDVEVDW